MVEAFFKPNTLLVLSSDETMVGRHIAPSKKKNILRKGKIECKIGGGGRAAKEK